MPRGLLGLWLLCAGAGAGAAEPPLLPVFFMHGLNGDAGWFDRMQGWIRARHPGTVTYSFPIAEKAGSVMNMWRQGRQLMEGLRARVAAQPAAYADGYALVCHSQGALLCRTAVELMDDHRVHTLIALAGPQSGEYGIPDGWQEMLPWARDEVYHFAYTAALQDHLSVANYWHDPRPAAGAFRPASDYWGGNSFLPVLNNDPQRRTQGWKLAKNETEAARYKANLLRLEKAVFTCSPADDQIIPYDSGIFNFFDPWPNRGSKALEETAMWREDWLGLRALHERGRLLRKNVSGVCHDCWARNATVFEEHVLPHLPRRPAAGAGRAAKAEALLV